MSPDADRLYDRVRLVARLNRGPLVARLNRGPGGGPGWVYDGTPERVFGELMVPAEWLGQPLFLWVEFRDGGRDDAPLIGAGPVHWFLG